MSRMKNRKIVGINRKSKNRGRVGMLNKIHRLRSVGMDNGIATGFGILYVAEEAYPLIHTCAATNIRSHSAGRLDS